MLQKEVGELETAAELSELFQKGVWQEHYTSRNVARGFSSWRNRLIGSLINKLF